MSYFNYLLKRTLFGANKGEFVSYPLFQKLEELRVYLDDVQQSAVTRLLDKLQNGIYSKNKNNCLCGNCDSDLDTLISKIDMHGIPLNVVLCGKCGLIRSADKFDGPSNADYYRFEYRDIHGGCSQTVGNYFTSQIDRGNSFLQIAAKSGIMRDIEKVVEIGCGCGGVLYPFHLEGKKVAGFDYDERYLDYGRGKGMDLYCLGKDATIYRQAAPDLLILSHVVEHFINPIEELVAHIETVEPGKYLLIEVPGIFSTTTKKLLYGYPIRYFQLAHVIQFYYRDYLECLYKALGLEIVHGDETATFILKKPLAWTRKIPDAVYEDKLSGYPALVNEYIKESYFDYRYRPDAKKVKWLVSDLLEIIGIRETVMHYLNKRKQR